MKFGINLYLWADDRCTTAGSSLLCGPHQVALGVFTGRGATDEERQRCIEHLRRVAEYAAAAGVGEAGHWERTSRVGAAG